MARRTLAEMVSQVSRDLPKSVPLGIIQREIIDACSQLCSSYEWPWLYKDADLYVPPSLTTGTVSVPAGSATVTGAGTAWPTGQPGYRLRIGGAVLDRQVHSIDSPTQLTLESPVGQVVSGATYSLYVDALLVPADMAVGGDVMLTQPNLRYRVKHLPRYTFEQQMTALRTFQSTIPTGFTDDGYDETTGRRRIRFCPPVTGPQEFRLTYRMKAPDLTSMAAISTLPDEFDQVLPLMATARVGPRAGLNGVAVAAAAAQARALVILLRKAAQGANVDNLPGDHIGGSDSSISQGGLSILPWGVSA